MRPGQETFARPASDVQGWVKTQEDKATFGLYDVVKNMKPTMLVSRPWFPFILLLTDLTSNHRLAHPVKAALSTSRLCERWLST